MNINTLFALLFILLFSSNLKAQTYYFPDPPSAVVVNSCDSVKLHLTGYFNDGCGYFNLNYNSTQLIGNDINCHITARNYGCDSGWICTFALVPVNSVYTFPPINANGTYNLKLVSHNVCMGMDNIVITNVGTYNLTTFATNNVLTSNAVGNVYIGMPVTYQLATNIPNNFMSNWYRNGVMVNSSANATSWSTTIQSNSDTVSVKIESDTLCILEPDKWSNKVILNVNPNSIEMPSIEQIHVYRDRNSNQLIFSNLKGNETIQLFSMLGEKLFECNLLMNHQLILPFNIYPNSIYILKIVQEGNMKIIKF